MVMLFLASLCLADEAWTDNLVFRGYLDLRATYSNVSGTPWNTIQRLRPTVSYYVHDRIKLSATLNAAMTQGRYEVGEFIDLVDNAFTDLIPPDLDGNRPTLEEVADECGWKIETERTINSVDDVLELARFYADVNTPMVDFRIGRQALNWGSAQFFNPTDVFNENMFAEPWRERTGLNAIRANAPLGESGLLTAVATIDDEFEEWKMGLKAGTNAMSTDLYLVGFSDGEELMLGVNLKGDLHIGWWLEGGWFDSFDSPFENGHLEFSLGADYSFPVLEQLTVMAQISHDGSGEIPELYDWAARQNPDLVLPACDAYNFPTSEVTETRQTLGRWYGLGQLMLIINDEWRVSSLALFNLADNTGMLYPSFSYTGESFTLNTGAQFLIGSDGEFRPPKSQTTQFGKDISEFIPTWTVISWLRWNY